MQANMIKIPTVRWHFVFYYGTVCLCKTSSNLEIQNSKHLLVSSINKNYNYTTELTDDIAAIK